MLIKNNNYYIYKKKEIVKVIDYIEGSNLILLKNLNNHLEFITFTDNLSKINNYICYDPINKPEVNNDKS